MPKRTRDHQSWLIEKLTDPARARDYLNTAHEDSREVFLEALRDVAQARQMSKVAKNAGVTRESLYRATSEIGNPTLETFESVLKVLGLKIVFEVADTVDASAPILEEAFQVQRNLESGGIPDVSSRGVTQPFYRPDKIVSPVAESEFLEDKAPMELVVSESQGKGIYARPH